jgi:Spy/CpxP family protein refolding chaperone
VVISPKLKIYGVVLGIFVLGAGAGGAAGYAMASKRIAEAFREDRPGLGDARRVEALSHELDLSREQRKQVRVIMERHRDQNRVLTRAMFERCGDDLQDLREKVDAEIRGVLSPEQQQRFKELMDQRGKRFPLGRPGPRRHKDKD